MQNKPKKRNLMKRQVQRCAAIGGSNHRWVLNPREIRRGGHKVGRRAGTFKAEMFQFLLKFKLFSLYFSMNFYRIYLKTTVTIRLKYQNKYKGFSDSIARLYATFVKVIRFSH